MRGVAIRGWADISVGRKGADSGTKWRGGISDAGRGVTFGFPCWFRMRDSFTDFSQMLVRVARSIPVVMCISLILLPSFMLVNGRDDSFAHRKLDGSKLNTSKKKYIFAVLVYFNFSFLSWYYFICAWFLTELLSKAKEAPRHFFCSKTLPELVSCTFQVVVFLFQFANNCIVLIYSKHSFWSSNMMR